MQVTYPLSRQNYKNSLFFPVIRRGSNVRMKGSFLKKRRSGREKEVSSPLQLYLRCLRLYLRCLRLYLRCLRLYRQRVETKANGLSQPFERLALLIGSLIPIREVRGSGITLSTTQNLSHTISIQYTNTPMHFNSRQQWNGFTRWSTNSDAPRSQGFVSPPSQGCVLPSVISWYKLLYNSTQELLFLFIRSCSQEASYSSYSSYLSSSHSGVVHFIYQNYESVSLLFISFTEMYYNRSVLMYKDTQMMMM